MPRGVNYLLKEDGIVDELAIEIAASGMRKVKLTPVERKMAVERMVKSGESARAICQRIGTNGIALREILAELGYECIRNGKQNEQRTIVPIDRPKPSTAAFLVEALQSLTERG